MSRKNKNIILSILLILLIIGTVFTIISAKDSNKNIRDDRPQLNEKMNIDDPSNTNRMRKPNENRNNDNQNNVDNKLKQMGNNPENMPMQRPDKNFKSNKQNNTLDTKYYILFGIEGLSIGLIIVYLIISNFNKKSYKECLKSTDKKIIYLLSSILLGTIIFSGSYYITRNGTNNKNSNKEIRDINSSNNNEVSKNASGNKEVTSTEELNDNYSTDKSDMSAIVVKEGGNATISKSEITKSGDSTNTENSELYGINAGILVTKESSATIKDSTITTSAKGANAVFSTGENSKIVISNSTIKTTGSSSSRGLDATYGGYIEADNVDITTKGDSSATLATDRGEGTVKVINSKLETNGKGSPLIYSTGDISIDKTTGTSNNSQLVVIEGKNSATITNSKIEASGKGNRGDVDQAGIMIYQSMSGDASSGNGTFTSKSSTLTIQSKSDYYKTAPMFFITNTDATINLEDTELIYGSNILISAKGTSEWGSENSNGGNVSLNAKSQKLVGDILIDNISTLTMNLTNSSYKGTINGDNSAKQITLKLNKDSKITLTGDSYITNLENELEDNSNIELNGYKLYVNGKSIK